MVSQSFGRAQTRASFEPRWKVPVRSLQRSMVCLGQAHIWPSVQIGWRFRPVALTDETQSPIDLSAFPRVGFRRELSAAVFARFPCTNSINCRDVRSCASCRCRESRPNSSSFSRVWRASSVAVTIEFSRSPRMSAFCVVGCSRQLAEVFQLFRQSPCLGNRRAPDTCSQCVQS